MPCCRICGEIKEEKEFYNIPNFSKHKKQKVVWCRDCQKMWLDQKKQKEYAEKYLFTPQSFSVSFN